MVMKYSYSVGQGISRCGRAEWQYTKRLKPRMAYHLQGANYQFPETYKVSGVRIRKAET